MCIALTEVDRAIAELRTDSHSGAGAQLSWINELEFLIKTHSEIMTLQDARELEK
jgi:hypothetical protein